MNEHVLTLANIAAAVALGALTVEDLLKLEEYLETKDKARETRETQEGQS